MMPASSHTDLRADIARPRPELSFRLRRAETRPDRWQVVLDIGDGADTSDLQIGGW